MGSLLSTISKSVAGETHAGALKLEAQRINEFNGEFEQWPKWKS
jgi:hypothetical protein